MIIHGTIITQLRYHGHIRYHSQNHSDILHNVRSLACIPDMSSEFNCVDQKNYERNRKMYIVTNVAGLNSNELTQTHTSIYTYNA